MDNYKKITLKDLASELESWASRVIDLEDDEIEYKATRKGTIDEYINGIREQSLNVDDAAFLLSEYAERSGDLDDEDIEIVKISDGKIYLYDFLNNDNSKNRNTYDDNDDNLTPLSKFLMSIGLKVTFEAEKDVSINGGTRNKDMTKVDMSEIDWGKKHNGYGYDSFFMVTKKDRKTLKTIYYAPRGSIWWVLKNCIPYTKDEVAKKFGKIHNEDDNIGSAAKTLLK